MVIQMEMNRCVSCGTVIPEGDHICKQCLEESNIIIGNSNGNILVTLSFYNFDVKIENADNLLETLFKYYIFKTNMTTEGQFNYRFVCENIIGDESISHASYRLFSEYIGVVKTIESMMIKK